jgi:hypothetical protein
MGAGLLAVKSGFILFIKSYQFPLQINTLERERERERCGTPQTCTAWIKEIVNKENWKTRLRKQSLYWEWEKDAVLNFIKISYGLAHPPEVSLTRRGGTSVVHDIDVCLPQDSSYGLSCVFFFCETT